jgi:hypothetical protein
MMKDDSARSLAILKKFGIHNIKKVHAKAKHVRKLRRNPPRKCRQNHPKNSPAKRLIFSDTPSNQRNNNRPQISRKAQRRESRQIETKK